MAVMPGASMVYCSGAPRVTDTYSENTPPQQYTIEAPGMTAIYPVRWLQDHLGLK